jgi:hypothetical protein
MLLNTPHLKDKARPQVQENSGSIRVSKKSDDRVISQEDTIGSLLEVKVLFQHNT